MDIYLSSDLERLLGTASRYRLDDPGFQPQCRKDKQYQSTFSRILILTHCKKMTW